MTRKQRAAAVNSSTGAEFSLYEPGMGEYERAGLAGLHLSLTAARLWQRQRSAWPLPRDVAKRLDDLNAHVTNHPVRDFPLAEDGNGIRLEWRAGTEIATLRAIVNWAWQVHDGALFLPGIHRKRQHLDCYYLRLHAHTGLLGTYFQFPRTIKKMAQQRKVERYDAEKTFTVSYRPISPEAQLPQSKAVPRQGVCNDKPGKPFSNWMYPGSEPRFNTRGTKRETGWQGPARMAYLMLFAPIACHFIKLPRSMAGGRRTDNWAYMVPHVVELQSFQRDFLRRNMVNLSNWPFYGEVAGLEDAVLRYAVRHRPGQSITVVMGHAAYYHDQQKTRKNLWRELADTNDLPKVFRRYDIFNRTFPSSRVVRSKTIENDKDFNATNGSHRVYLPSSRERITANLLRGNPWYSDLAYIPFWQRDQVESERKRSRDGLSVERLWFQKLCRYERPQLKAIIGENGMWDDPFEKEVLTAFTQAFRRLLNREETAIGRGGSRELTKRWDNTMDRWHRRLMNAKTSRLLSDVVHELLALASRSPPGGPAFLLSAQDRESREAQRVRNDDFRASFRRMLNHPAGWKTIRDLALLAMATFADQRLSQSGDKPVTDRKEDN